MSIPVKMTFAAAALSVLAGCANTSSAEKEWQFGLPKERGALYQATHGYCRINNTGMATLFNEETGQTISTDSATWKNKWMWQEHENADGTKIYTSQRLEVCGYKPEGGNRIIGVPLLPEPQNH